MHVTCSLQQAMESFLKCSRFVARVTINSQEHGVFWSAGLPCLGQNAFIRVLRRVADLEKVTWRIV